MGDTNSGTSPTASNADKTSNRLESFHPECTDLKQKYDQCFNTWFTEHYMNGHYNNNECQNIFQIYTECVKRGMNEYGLQYEQSTSIHLGTNKEKNTLTDSEKTK